MTKISHCRQSAARLVLISLMWMVLVPLNAQIKIYTGTLSGLNEVMPVMTTGTGQVTLTLNTAAQTLRIQVTFSSLVGNTAMAHVHCCALPGNNVGVATMLPSLIGFPVGVNGGSMDQTLNLLDAMSYSGTFLTNPGGGTAAGASAALEAGLDAGTAYFNIHTSSFPGGEIRANLQLLPAAAVPTLSTWAVLVLMVVLLITGLSIIKYRARAMAFLN